jgi:spermidine/putrescine transport system ATP-binding protein/putrescine transport system ATP-binding protein
MAEGRVIQVDTPAGLYDRPQSRRVAAFVGTMNFFDARVSGHGPDRTVEMEGLGRSAVNGAAFGHGDGDRVLVAIRPEGFALSLAPPADVGPSAAGRLMARQYLGGRQLLHVAVEGCKAPVAVAALAHRGADPWEGREGHPVWLCWKQDALSVLDAD